MIGTAALVRVVVLLAICAGIVASLARPPLDQDARWFVLLVVAGVAAWSARSALLLMGARKGLLVVDASAPKHRLGLATLPASIAGLAIGALVALTPVVDQVAIVVTGIACALVGVALSRMRDAKAKGPRKTSRIAWLVVDTALPAGIIAALVSTALGLSRWHAMDAVGGTEIARHLAATTFAYSFFLGLGGFLKAYGEQTSGLVVVEKSSASVPGPIVAGGILGVVLIFVGPRVLPALPLQDVLVLKACVGLVVGGTLSLLGALQGARAASVGLKRS